MDSSKKDFTSIQIGDNTFLQCERYQVDDFPDNIVVTLLVNDCLQDLVVVSQKHNEENPTQRTPNTVNVYVYSDSENEDWTHKFTVSASETFT